MVTNVVLPSLLHILQALQTVDWSSVSETLRSPHRAKRRTFYRLSCKNELDLLTNIYNISATFMPSSASADTVPIVLWIYRRNATNLTHKVKVFHKKLLK